MIYEMAEATTTKEGDYVGMVKSKKIGLKMYKYV